MPELLGCAFLLTGFLVDLELVFNPWQYREYHPPTPLPSLCVLYLLGSDQILLNVAKMQVSNFSTMLEGSSGTNLHGLPSSHSCG